MRQGFFRSFAFAGACGLLAAAADVHHVLAEGYGTVAGQFVLEGAAPSLDDVVKKGDAIVRDAAVCSKDNVPNESLVVDPRSKGIANVFVFLAKKPADVYPDLQKSKSPVVKFDQKNCRFIPHAMILRTDQEVEILSDDPISHNTHVHALRSDPKNEAVSGNTREGGPKWKFPMPEKYVTSVKCDIHPWMNAWWLITDHPYAAVTDQEGRFQIDKVPAGDHEFMVWQEKSGWVFGPKQRSIKVTVKPNETTNVLQKVPAANFEKQ